MFAPSSTKDKKLSLTSKCLESSWGFEIASAMQTFFEMEIETYYDVLKAFGILKTSEKAYQVMFFDM